MIEPRHRPSSSERTARFRSSSSRPPGVWVWRSVLTAGALACATTAVAQSSLTQSSVTLYGVADADVRLDHTNLGMLRSVGSGGESGSRWGIRGFEDLGNGLRATFIFEQGVDISDNSSAQGSVGGGASLGPGSLGGANSAPHSSTGGRLFGRVSTVGLATPYGEIRFGRSFTPIHLIVFATDPFGTGYVASANNVMINDTLRDDNAIWYDTPRIAGFAAALVYQLGESTTDDRTPVTGGQAKHGDDRYGANVTYRNGPIYAGIGYDTMKSNFDSYRVRSANFAATYDFSIVKLHAIYWQTRNNNENRNAAFGSTVAQNERSYLAGITVPYGAFDFFGSVARLQDRSQSNVDAPLGTPKANFFGVGARYSFSKRTIVYAGTSHFSLHNGPCGNAFQAYNGIIDASNVALYNAANLNGPSVTCRVSGSPVSIVTPSNVNPTSYEIGMRHSF